MFSLDPKKTALIIVDMQNAFISKEGSISKLGINVDRTQQIIEPIQKLLKAFHDAGAAVIFTKMNLRKDYSDAGILEEAFPPLKGLGHAVAGSWDGKLIKDFKPCKEDYVIEKCRFSGFYNTSLETVLRCKGVENLIMVGVATNICVESTVRDAFYRDFRVFVPKDATASYTEDMERGSFINFDFGFAKVTTTEEILEGMNASMN